MDIYRKNKTPRGKRDGATSTLGETIVMAAVSIGRDGKGAGGAVGYFEALAVQQPKLFVGLLGRVLAGEEAEPDVTSLLRRMKRIM